MGKNANKRKSEKQTIVITPTLTAKAFIEECKSAASKISWTSGYTPALDLSDQLAAEINKKISELANPAQMRTKIINSYPNYGTYTYTDGVVDYVLGALVLNIYGAVELV